MIEEEYSKPTTLRPPPAVMLLCSVGVTMAIILSAACTLFIVTTKYEADKRFASFAVMLFVDSRTSAAQTEALTTQAKNLPGVDSLEFISSEDVEQSFNRRFSTRLDGILPDNPFSPVVILRLLPEFRTKTKAEELSAAAKKLRGAQEVYFNAALLANAEDQARITFNRNALAACITALVVLLLLWFAVAHIQRFEQGRVLPVVVGIILGFTTIVILLQFGAQRLNLTTPIIIPLFVAAGTGLCALIFLVLPALRRYTFESKENHVESGRSKEPYI